MKNQNPPQPAAPAAAAARPAAPPKTIRKRRGRTWRPVPNPAYQEWLENQNPPKPAAPQPPVKGLGAAGAAAGARAGKSVADFFAPPPNIASVGGGAGAGAIAGIGAAQDHLTEAETLEALNSDASNLDMNQLDYVNAGPGGQ